MYSIDVNISPFAIVLNVAAFVDSADLVVVPVEVVFFVDDLVCITLFINNNNNNNNNSIVYMYFNIY